MKILVLFILKREKEKERKREVCCVRGTTGLPPFFKRVPRLQCLYIKTNKFTKLLLFTIEREREKQILITNFEYIITKGK